MYSFGRSIPLVALLLAALPVASQAAFEQCRGYFPAGHVPVVEAAALEPRDLCFDGFAVLHSGVTKTPIYAVERLDRARLVAARGVRRASRFYEEARLPSRERARLADYQRSGWDRGHMAPAGDMPNANAMAQCFSLANVVPQAPRDNRETWSRVERDTRRYAMRARGDVYVFTGPWYGEETSTIGAGRVRVPAAVWKLVYDPESGRSWAHWSENTATAAVRPPIGYDEFVRRTGLRLLP